MVKGDIETVTMNSTVSTSTPASATGQQSNVNGFHNRQTTTNKNRSAETGGDVVPGPTDVAQIADASVECPLCMENLEIDDLGFFPCSCGYQVCRFCWHRLKNDDNGLCPACRQPYPDSPIQFNSAISIERVEEYKKMKKKQKEKQKLKDSNKLQNLSTIRVVQKNLLFVIGIPQRFTQEELRKEFNKYGKIVKMVINSNNNSNTNLNSHASAYVTYTRAEDAVAAIKTLNDSSQSHNANTISSAIGTNTKPTTRNNSLHMMTNGTNSVMMTGSILTTVKASLGTTKYCTHWLRCQTCPKQPDCMYLHELAEPEASFTKEEMQAGKHTEYEKRLIAHYLEVICLERQQQEKERLQPTAINMIQNQSLPVSKQQQQQTQQQRPFNNNSGGNMVGGGFSSSAISPHHRKSSSTGSNNSSTCNNGNHFGENAKPPHQACDYDDYNQQYHALDEQNHRSNNKKNYHHQNMDQTNNSNENGVNTNMMNGDSWSSPNIDKSTNELSPKTTAAIKIMKNNHQQQNKTDMNENGGHNSDSSSGNSSLSSTPNHHHHHHHSQIVVDSSMMFSNVFHSSSSSSTTSGTYSLSCDESSNSSSSSTSSSSTPDNIQQAKQQQESSSTVVNNTDNGVNGLMIGDQANTTDRVNDVGGDTDGNNVIEDEDDDDDLDFDPISFSHQALEDLLRSSTTNNGTNGVGCGNRNSNLIGFNQTGNSSFMMNGGNVRHHLQPSINNMRSNFIPHNNNNIHHPSATVQSMDFPNTDQVPNNLFNRLAMLNMSAETTNINNNHNGFGARTSPSSTFQMANSVGGVNNSQQSAFNQNMNLLSMIQQQKQNLDQQVLMQQQLSSAFDQKSSLNFNNINNNASNGIFAGGQTSQLFGSSVNCTNNTNNGQQKLPQWQQQQNSLRQLLPNVNIKFQQQQELNGGVGQFIQNSGAPNNIMIASNHSPRHQPMNNGNPQQQLFWPSPNQSGHSINNAGNNNNNASSPSPQHQSNQMSPQQQQQIIQQQKMQHYLQMQQQQRNNNNLNQFLLSQMLSGNGNPTPASHQQQVPQMRQQAAAPPGFNDSRF